MGPGWALPLYNKSTEKLFREVRKGSLYFFPELKFTLAASLINSFLKDIQGGGVFGHGKGY